MNTGEVTSNGLRVAFAASGDGQPVVLLHGVAENKRWMAPLFAELATTNRAYNLDLPGHGGSARNGDRVGFRDAVEWLDGVLDALGLGSVTLIGNSLGGRFALEYALRHPERVDKLVGIATPLAIHSNRGGLVPLASIVPPRIAALIPLERMRRNPAMRRRVRTMLLGMLYADPMAADEHDIEEAVDGALDWLSDPEARTLYLAWIKRIYLEDPKRFWARMDGLKPPTLLLFGQQDSVVASGQAERVERRVAAARTLVVPDAGHAMLREARGVVIPEVLSFVR